MIRLMSLTVLATIAATPVVYAQMETGSDSISPRSSATAETFAELSPGNQMIARSLMDAQTMPDADMTRVWTLDQIAAARSETGWGEVFHRLQSEGLIRAENLGQVVSQFQHGGSTAVTTGTAGMAVLPAAASGARVHGRSGSNGSAAPDLVDAGNGIAAGAGGTADGNAAVNAAASNRNTPSVGHELPVSAAPGIATATGAGASAGISAGVTTRAGAHGGGVTANAGLGVHAGTGANAAITAGPADAAVTAHGGGIDAAGKAHAFGRGK